VQAPARKYCFVLVLLLADIAGGGGAIGGSFFSYSHEEQASERWNRRKR